MPVGQLDFDVLFELRERSDTDYLAPPIPGVHAVDYMVKFVTDQPSGLTRPQSAEWSIHRRRSLPPYPMPAFAPLKWKTKSCNSLFPVIALR